MTSLKKRAKFPPISTQEEVTSFPGLPTTLRYGSTLSIEIRGGGSLITRQLCRGTEREGEGVEGRV